VSHHAGIFLCNGLYYLSQHLVCERGLKTRSLFVHVPLDTSQANAEVEDFPSLPAEQTAAGVRLLLKQLLQASV